MNSPFSSHAVPREMENDEGSKEGRGDGEDEAPGHKCLVEPPRDCQLFGAAN